MTFVGGGDVLAGTIDKTTTVSTVLAHSLAFNEDTVLCSIRNIFPCWHGKKLGLGQILGLCMEGFREPVAAFTHASILERAVGVKEGQLGSVSSILIIRVGAHLIPLYQSRNRSIGPVIVIPRWALAKWSACSCVRIGGRVRNSDLEIDIGMESTSGSIGGRVP